MEGSLFWELNFYPHYLRKSNTKKDIWYYNDNKELLEVKQKNIIGKGGTVACWHGLTSHGTYYNFSKTPRALRYLIKPDSKSKNSPFLNSFKDIKGKISIKDISKARLDLNDDRSFRKTGMSITF